MHCITKKWDRTDTLTFTFGGVALFAITVLQLGLVLAALFTVGCLGFTFALWLRVP